MEDRGVKQLLAIQKNENKQMLIRNPNNPKEIITGKEIVQAILVLGIAGYIIITFISNIFIHTAYIGDEEHTYIGIDVTGDD